VGALSGGNVQRTVLARELDGSVEVLIAAAQRCIPLGQRRVLIGGGAGWLAVQRLRNL
jgi:hypothetical protein